jgi:hypothetical protein
MTLLELMEKQRDLIAEHLAHVELLIAEERLRAQAMPPAGAPAEMDEEEAIGRC